MAANTKAEASRPAVVELIELEGMIEHILRARPTAMEENHDDYGNS